MNIGCLSKPFPDGTFVLICPSTSITKQVEEEMKDCMIALKGAELALANIRKRKRGPRP